MKPELKSLLKAMFLPSLLIFIIIMVRIIEVVFHLSLSQYGLIPLDPKGLIGIITAPFLHMDLKHVVSNCVPLFITGTALFYFYKEFALKLFIFMLLLTGFLTWLMGRGYSTHIGASGVVYALISFHLSSAIIRQRRDLTAFSFVVVLLYGGFFWGFFPDFFPDRNISWESHLSGAISGLIFALYYKDKGPQKIVHEWDDEDDENENDDETRYWEHNNSVDDTNPDNVSTTLPGYKIKINNNLN